MARILRGDIIWVNSDPTQGHEQSEKRPVLILSNHIFNDRSGTVIAVAITSQPQRASYPLTFEVEKPLLGKKVWIKISQIRTLSTLRLGKKIGSLEPEELDKIIEGLNEIVE